jgi:Protein of unknown function (DUF2589)
MAKTDLKTETENERSAPVLTPEQAQATIPAGLASALASATPADVAALAAQIAGLGTETANVTTPVTTTAASVTDELGDGGPAFGTFLSKVGMAVADTQKALDLTMVETARALSAEKVEVVSVFEQEIDESGNMGAGKVHMQKVPLVTLVTPTSLQFKQVFVTADMEVEEFTSNKGLTIKKSHTDFNVNAKAKYSVFGGFGASGGTNLNTSSDNYADGQSTATDKAAGKLHMEATIEPREIPLPQPFVVQKGPRLSLTMADRKSVGGEGGAAEVGDDVATARVVTLKGKLIKSDGTALGGKTLAVNVEGGFPFTVSGPTDTGGEVTITIRRSLGKENRDPVNTVVGASLNLVTSSLTITI